MKILVDMNLSPGWVDFLAGYGIETLHWSSIGLPDDPDTEILAYAKEHGYTILTNDLDFGLILALTHNEKPSVIQIRTGALGPGWIGSLVIDAIQNLSAGIEKGALVTIDINKTRIRLLPFVR